ncbi:MAG: VOC family protein [Filimonas sp.]|nr:VOC family protein [Filimonas sp.]
MAKQIFVNLPVKDLDKSISFFSKLGFTFNPQFTDDKATCMVVSDTIYVMLLVEKFFKTFTKKDIADAKKNTEAIIALSADSRQDVDDIIKKAVAAGGHSPKDAQDDGWMYGRGFEDLDGHLWEILYMDESAV